MPKDKRDDGFKVMTLDNAALLCCGNRHLSPAKKLLKLEIIKTKLKAFIAHGDRHAAKNATEYVKRIETEMFVLKI